MMNLVLVPGIMSDRRTWAALDTALAGQFAVWDADTTQDETIEAMARRALDSVPGEMVIVAHSMGSRVAMEMGRLAGERVAAMVLSNGAYGAATAAEGPKRQARIEEANADMAAYAAAWVPTVVAAENLGRADLVTAVRQMVMDCGPAVHARQNRALLTRPDAGDYVGAFDFPVLLITGDQDHLSPEPAQRLFASLFQRAQVAVIAGAGHLTPFEQPGPVVRVVSDWLAAEVTGERPV
jgi:pimeloyl-ACP methyl ester carboxylesterase